MVCDQVGDITGRNTCYDTCQIAIEGSQQCCTIAAQGNPIYPNPDGSLSANPGQQPTQIPQSLCLGVNRVQDIPAEYGFPGPAAHGAGTMQRQDRESQIEAKPPI